MTKTLIDRIEENIMVDPNSGCWLWTLSLKPEGYGSIKINGRSRLAHRISYEEFVGPVPRGLQLDHLCRTRSCVNPKHLEPVTLGENIRRGDTGKTARARWASKTHCKKGHAFAEHSYISVRDGYNRRICRICKAAANARWLEKVAH